MTAKDAAPDSGPERNTPAGLDGRLTRHLRKEPLAQVVKNRLLDDVVSGVYPPGTMISLATLAERYGVSRTPVREALSVLEHEGLVTVFPYQGFLINSASVSELKDLYFMREVVETAAARRAAERVTEEDVERLRSYVSAGSPSKTYSTTFDDHSRDFHVAIAQLSGSARLEAAVSDIFRSVARLQFIGVNPPDTTTIVDDHVAIIEALASGDAQAAHDLMERHIVDLRLHALRALIE